MPSREHNDQALLQSADAQADIALGGWARTGSSELHEPDPTALIVGAAFSPKEETDQASR